MSEQKPHTCETCKHLRVYPATRWDPEDYDCTAPDSLATAEWDGTSPCPGWEEYIEPDWSHDDGQGGD